jgi:primosomal protein N' (replication factor Y)
MANVQRTPGPASQSSAPPLYAAVAVPLPLAAPLTYAIPPEIAPALEAGVRVRVPLARREVTGYVVGFPPEAPPVRLRPILEVLDETPVLDAHLLALTRWTADYYFAPWGEVLRAALPPGLTALTRRVIRLSPGTSPAALRAADGSPAADALAALFASRPTVPVQVLARRVGPAAARTCLTRLARQDLVRVEPLLPAPRDRPRTVRCYALAVSPEETRKQAEALRARAPRQAEMLERLLQAGGELPAEELRRGGGSGADLALVRRGLVRPSLREVRRDPLAPYLVEGGEAPLPPTPAQAEALAAIEAARQAARFGVFLLFGVTGSGKTEVYLQAIAATLAAGRQALVLVPEIALTPAATARFAARFGRRVALLHSGLGAGERFDEWRRIRAGEADIVVGARSAVFAPLPRLGLLIVDEEQDGAYKQEEVPRYHARDVAIVRARLLGCPVLLGSATPALESYANAERGRSRLLTLPGRLGEARLPTVQVVDMRQEMARAGRLPLLSALLKERMAFHLARGGQVLLLLNRRGYAAALLCRDCGLILRCPRCSVSLIWHATVARGLCHHCGFSRKVPEACPECAGSRLRQFGVGTEQLERLVQETYPTARVARMDRDTTAGAAGHRAILSRLAGGALDILVGTQMIAKGHDYPGVTLVGVLAADLTLNLPDFRAGERTFTLLTQMVGRSGRGRDPGEGIIQTFAPEHYAIRAALAQDYPAFYREETPLRRARRLPPFTRTVRLLCAAPAEGTARAAAERLAALLQGKPGVEVDGPAPAPLLRLRGTYRWHLLAKGKAASPLHRAVRAALAGGPPPGRAGLRIDVDADPLDLW